MKIPTPIGHYDTENDTFYIEDRWYLSSQELADCLSIAAKVKNDKALKLKQEDETKN